MRQTPLPPSGRTYCLTQAWYFPVSNLRHLVLIYSVQDLTLNDQSFGYWPISLDSSDLARTPSLIGFKGSEQAIRSETQDEVPGSFNQHGRAASHNNVHI